jgi:ribose-phosphate pyrophosphokinase
MKVIAGTASQRLGERVANVLDVGFIKPYVEKFPDGEIYVRVDDEVDDTMVLIQTTYPNDKIIEFMLLQDALREKGVKNIISVVPYFGYSRQDRIFKNGEAISARAMVKHLSLESDFFIGIDLHSENLLKWFKIPVKHLHATQPISEWLKGKGVDMVISPDKGGYTRARLVAENIDVEFDYLEKTRLSGTEVVIKPKNLDVDGRVVGIVDDIISTGGTIARAAEQLREQGAKKIYAICTHGLFIGHALENMKKVDDFAATDTIESENSKITVAGVIAEAIKSI